MKYTALAVLFLLACVVVGTRFPAAQRPAVAICLAAAMVGAELALLLWS
jgi:hypothetical protein